MTNTTIVIHVSGKCRYELTAQIKVAMLPTEDGIIEDDYELTHQRTEMAPEV